MQQMQDSTFDPPVHSMAPQHTASSSIRLACPLQEMSS